MLNDTGHSSTTDSMTAMADFQSFFISTKADRLINSTGTNMYV
ncbi:hypothetical protein OYT1_ch2335 [Ferriphaselus amnicola]|uniref:Uncharacterized protein n=1 Tax=Ferriphaselus amnicola TaxID=1188319 RepID=A0A2Z6GEK3_9PROT|nr:hypothetical protein OYT1_ch2335 [Ferriphaselus amnicola]